MAHTLARLTTIVSKQNCNMLPPVSHLRRAAAWATARLPSAPAAAHSMNRGARAALALHAGVSHRPQLPLLSPPNSPFRQSWAPGAGQLEVTGSACPQDCYMCMCTGRGGGCGRLRAGRALQAVSQREGGQMCGREPGGGWGESLNAACAGRRAQQGRMRLDPRAGAVQAPAARRKAVNVQRCRRSVRHTAYGWQGQQAGGTVA